MIGPDYLIIQETDIIKKHKTKESYAISDKHHNAFAFIFFEDNLMRAFIKDGIIVEYDISDPNVDPNGLLAPHFDKYKHGSTTWEQATEKWNKQGG